MRSIEIKFWEIPCYRNEMRGDLEYVTPFLWNQNLRVAQEKIVKTVLQINSVTLPDPPKIIPASLNTYQLRGWSGIDEIFVNLAPFQLHR